MKVPPSRCLFRVATWAVLVITCALVIVCAAVVAAAALSWITAKVGTNT